MNNKLKTALSTSALVLGGVTVGVCGVIVLVEVPAIAVGAGALFATKKAVEYLSKEDDR